LQRGIPLHCLCEPADLPSPGKGALQAAAFGWCQRITIMLSHSNGYGIRVVFLMSKSNGVVLDLPGTGRAAYSSATRSPSELRSSER
jgi:hypothetical protein